MADAQAQVERAHDQVVGWLEHFEELELAVLPGADGWVEVALFGKRKLEIHQLAAVQMGDGRGNAGAAFARRVLWRRRDIGHLHARGRHAEVQSGPNVTLNASRPSHTAAEA